MKNKYLLLSLCFLLAACNNTNNSSSSIDKNQNSSSSNISLSSSSSIDNSSSSTDNSDSSSSTNNQTDLVTEKIGTLNKLYDYLNSYTDIDIKSLQKSKSTQSSTTNETTLETVTFRLNETLSISKTTNLNTNEIKTNTNYLGIINDVYYDLSVYDYTNSSASRKLIVDEPKYGYNDQITPADAENDFDSKNANFNLLSLTGYSFWNKLFSTSFNQRNDYTITPSGDNFRVTITGYNDKYATKSDYSFIATFDKNLNILSGTFNEKQYDKNSWDSTNHTPVSGATHIVYKKTSLDSVIYGTPEQSTSPMFDITPYFMTSITNPVDNPITLQNYVYDATWSIVYSEPNQLITEAAIEIPTDYIKENNLYKPTTAIDLDSLIITNTTNEEAIVADGYGGWVAGKVDSSTTLTIGNSFIENLFTVDITIVKSPVLNAPNLTETAFIPLDNEVTVSFDSLNYRDEVILSNSNSRFIGLTTSNEGPFEDFSKITFTIANPEIISIKVATNQLELFDVFKSEFGNRMLYIEVTPLCSITSQTTVSIEVNNEAVAFANFIINIAE